MAAITILRDVMDDGIADRLEYPQEFAERARVDHRNIQFCDDLIERKPDHPERDAILQERAGAAWNLAFLFDCILRAEGAGC